MQRKNYPITFCVFCGCLVFLGGSYIFPKQLSLETSLEKLRQKTGIDNVKVDTSRKIPKDLKEYIDLAKLEQETILAQNSVRTTWFTALSTFFFVITAYHSWRNIKVSEKTLKVSEDQQVAERFNKAVELLTHEKKHIHLGGIYALGSILDQENDYYHKQVIQTLAAYLRENAPYPKLQSSENLSFPDQINPRKIELPRANIQAVMDILATNNCQDKEEKYLFPVKSSLFPSLTKLSRFRRIANILSNSQRKNGKKKKKIYLDLSYTDLQGIQIGGGCGLSGAKFVGSNLQGAELSDVNLKYADFSGAILSNVKFIGATLRGARFDDADCSNAIFDGVDDIALCYTPPKV